MLDVAREALTHAPRTVAGDTAQDEEIRENVNDVSRLQLTSNPDCNAFTRELVDHVEHAVLLSIVGSILNEVV